MSTSRPFAALAAIVALCLAAPLGCAAEISETEPVGAQTAALTSLTASEARALSDARGRTPGPGRYRAVQDATRDIARSMLARSAGAEADRRGVMAWRSDVLNDPDLEEDRLAVRRAIADERRAYTPTAADLAADGHARRFLAGLP